MHFVKITESAKNDLHQIASFIVEDTGFIEKALFYIQEIQNSIMSLKQYPDCGAIPKIRLLRLQGYRFLIVESHLVFYKVNHKISEVIVYGILHHKSNYQNLL